MTVPSDDGLALVAEANSLATVIRHLRPDDEQWLIAAQMISRLTGALDRERARSEGLRAALKHIKLGVVSNEDFGADDLVSFIDAALSTSPPPIPQQDAVRDLQDLERGFYRDGAKYWRGYELATLMRKILARLSHPIPAKEP